MAVTADYDAQSAVERELVLRLASLLWRLRRATSIETGLFKIGARHLLRLRKEGQARREPQDAGESVCGDNVGLDRRDTRGYDHQTASIANKCLSIAEPGDQLDDLTLSFVHLNDQPACPLDRLSRYEAMLWRQACQILFTLQFLNRRKPWGKLGLRP